MKRATHPRLLAIVGHRPGSIPTTISEGLKTGVLHRGDILAIGTFSNGGDFVSSMVLKL